ncbi:MAG: hypothetical protein OEY49_09015, partial [Candidatus Heimdallarchaeota archaeon]|nr:hypothetical protein [Candidatus Heimdallarchaeota archaeon]
MEFQRDHLHQSEFGFDVDELFDLTMIDLLILQQIKKYDEPTLKFTIMEDINEQIPETKRLNPTKFYYSVTKLKNLGLIDISEGKKKGTSQIIKTTQLEEVLNSLFSSLLLTKINFVEIFHNFLIKFKQLFNLKFPIDNLITSIPNFEKIIDLRKITILSQITNNLFILTEDLKFEHFNKRKNLDNITQTKMINNKIREPNDFFDIVLYLSFDYSINFEPKEYVQNFVLELIRICKQGGLIILTGIMKIEELEHLFLLPIYDILNKLIVYNPI